MFSVWTSRKAKKGLDEISREYAETAKQILKHLANEPVPTKVYDVKRLAGSPYYRIRFGKCRMVYAINWPTKEINVLKIERRSDETYANL